MISFNSFSFISIFFLIFFGFVDSKGEKSYYFSSFSDTTKFIRLSHHVNSSANEYFPCYDSKLGQLYFTGMDRTGFFDYKIDFTKSRNNGGEDIFVSNFSNGLFSDARPVISLNTNAHEAVNQVLSNGSILLTGNYSENMGPINENNGSATQDLFLAKPEGKSYRLIHFDEPVNSIFSDMDGFMFNNNIILFASDRIGHIGAYHKKGWLWEGNYWGNTDIYVGFKENGNWVRVLNLGTSVNTPYAERTPFLSPDGLSLYISSNGYKKGKYDQDIYIFKRKDINNWTSWVGPILLNGVNSSGDDWGYRVSDDGSVFFARSVKLGFVPTAKYKNGAGFVFETNFRTGYDVKGAQAGSFKQDEQTDIYYSMGAGRPSLSFSDILFDFDKSSIKKDQITSLIERLQDLIEVNQPLKIIIHGHTDSFGSEKYNQELSYKRASVIKKIIIDFGFPENLVTAEGMGNTMPLVKGGDKVSQQKNRRVDIFLY